MNIKSNIPNFITLGNLLCGCMALVTSRMELACLFIFIAAVLDFLDGMVARLLNVSSPLGKQLDSLADCVTFGVVPSFLAMKMLDAAIPPETFLEKWILVLPFMMALAGAWRLARFNIDESQSKYFKGLPIPANGILWIAIVMLYGRSLGTSDQPEGIEYIVIITSILSSLIMVSKLKLLNFKISSLAWKGNETRFVLLGLCAIAIIAAIILKSPFTAIPAVLLLYIVVSLLHYYKFYKDELQSGN